MNYRHIAMLVNTDIQLSTAVTARPGVEVYPVATEDDVEMALLTDLVVPCKVGFRGRRSGQDVRQTVRRHPDCRWPRCRSRFTSVLGSLTVSGRDPGKHPAAIAVFERRPPAMLSIRFPSCFQRYRQRSRRYTHRRSNPAMRPAGDAYPASSVGALPGAVRLTPYTSHLQIGSAGDAVAPKV